MPGTQSTFPHISIVIPARNEESLIRNCLESLGRLAYPKDRYEVIIADGLSEDSTVAIAHEFGAKVVVNEKMTVACGRNAGFSIARGEIVAFSDADCVMPTNWLANVAAHFSDRPELSGLGGITRSPEGQNNFQNAVSTLFSLATILTGSVHKESLRRPQKVSDIPGCNCFYRRKILEKVMPINESLLTAEDVEMNFRITEAGGTLYLMPDVMLWHYRRPTPRRLWRQMYRFAIGRVQVGKLNKRMIHLPHVLVGLSIPLTLIFMIITCLLGPQLLAASILLVMYMICSIILAVLVWRRSVSIAIAIPFAAAIMISAWSCGFLRELFFPMRRVNGH